MQMLTENHIAWMEQRAIDTEIASQLGLYSDNSGLSGRVVVAPFVRKGKVINHKYRDIGEKKFWMDADSDVGFFNEDILRDELLRDEPLVITEGEMDCIAAIQAGWQKSVSVPNGADSNLEFIKDELNGLPSESQIILAVDADDSGAKLGRTLLNLIGPVRCMFVKYPKNCKDLNDVAINHGNEGVDQVLKNAKEYPIKGLLKLDEYPDIKAPETFDVPWACLQENLRLWREEFCVITGVPSAGKSLFANSLMAYLAETHKHKIAIASFEMPIVPYVRDTLRHYAAGPQKLGFNYRGTDAWIKDRFVFIDPLPSGMPGQWDDEDIDPTIDWILETAEAAAIRHGIDWLLLDPWNQISHDMERHGSAEYQRRAIQKVKRFARRYKVGVFVVAHPTKGINQPNGKIRSPNLYDIDGSAHWYNAADHGIVLDRDTTQSKLQVSVKKSRFKSGGIVGEGWLNFDEHLGRYKATKPPISNDEGFDYD